MKSEHLTHVYDFSFVPRTRVKRTQYPPELVLVLSQTGWEQVEQYLQTSSISERVGAAEYLRRPFVESWLEPSFTFTPERVLFGYDQCGYVTRTESEVKIHFPLRPQSVMATALTLHAVMISVDICLVANAEELPRTNRFQLFTVSTRCVPEFPYGHAMQGYVFPAFRRWLIHAAATVELSMVETALRQAGHALLQFDTKKEEREYRKLMDCMFRAYIYADGRFVLTCPGNACDIAIYPDSMPTDVEHACNFSCHNLDTATQQLTLLAGLAALSDLARRELET